MVNLESAKPGDILQIAGQGAPGFAKLGSYVKVFEKITDGLRVVRPDGWGMADFVFQCGLARLSPLNPIELISLILIECNSAQMEIHICVFRKRIHEVTGFFMTLSEVKNLLRGYPEIHFGNDRGGEFFRVSLDIVNRYTN